MNSITQSPKTNPYRSHSAVRSVPIARATGKSSFQANRMGAIRLQGISNKRNVLPPSNPRLNRVEDTFVAYSRARSYAAIANGDASKIKIKPLRIGVPIHGQGKIAKGIPSATKRSGGRG